VDKNAQRPNQYNKYFDTLRFDGIDFPVKLSSISKFEKLNKDFCVTCQHRNCNDETHLHGLAIYVFEWKKDGLSPLRISDCNGYKIRLMLLHSENIWHYAFIKNFRRLLRQVTGNDGHRFWCDKCLYVTQYEQVMKRHAEDCLGIDQSPCKVIMPPPGDTIRFKNIRKQLKLRLYVIVISSV